jgi:hypothetical protein
MPPSKLAPPPSFAGSVADPFDKEFPSAPNLSDLVFEGRSRALGSGFLQLGGQEFGFTIALLKQIMETVPLGLLLFCQRAVDCDLTGSKIQFEVVRMRERFRACDPKFLSAFELSFPFELILERHIEHSVSQLFAIAFRFGEQLRENLLRTQLAARCVDGKSAHNRFRHRNTDLSIALANSDGPICFFDNDFLQAFFVRPRTLIASALGTAFRIAGSTGWEL